MSPIGSPAWRARATTPSSASRRPRAASGIFDPRAVRSRAGSSEETWRACGHAHEQDEHEGRLGHAAALEPSHEGTEDAPRSRGEKERLEERRTHRRADRRSSEGTDRRGAGEPAERPAPPMRPLRRGGGRAGPGSRRRRLGPRGAASVGWGTWAGPDGVDGPRPGPPAGGPAVPARGLGGSRETRRHFSTSTSVPRRVSVATSPRASTPAEAHDLLAVLGHGDAAPVKEAVGLVARHHLETSGDLPCLARR